MNYVCLWKGNKMCRQKHCATLKEEQNGFWMQVNNSVACETDLIENYKE